MIKFVDFNRKYKRYMPQINEATSRVFRRGIFINGPQLAKLETDFAKYLGIKYAVGVNSGTDAITIALKSAGIQPGDEVITTAFTAVPTIAAIRQAGAVPVFVDVDPATMNIDPAQIKKKITAKSKAILPVHLFGYPADMGKIAKVARENRLKVVEDACQAHGAKFSGEMVGTIGNAGCFSFYPTKNLGAFGDAGVIVTDDKKIAETARMLRNYGKISNYQAEIEGINSRLDELQASFLNWAIGQLDEWNKERQYLAGLYLENLTGLPIGLPPKSDAKHQRVWHQFVITTSQRDKLKEFLKTRGIETIVHYPIPVFMQAAYRFLQHKKTDFPVASGLSDDILSLPLYPELTPEEVSQTCKAIKSYYP